MRAAGLPELAVKTFEHYYAQLVAGATGLVPEREIEPIGVLPDATTFGPALAERGRRALAKTVLVKLNGGLATSMGLTGPKALLTVKGDLTFLDVVMRQAETHRIPLVLMDSFSTHAATLAAVAKHPKSRADLVVAFEQHMIPKVTKDGFAPGAWPKDPQLEWCPPGHGNLYAALATSGALGRLLADGYEHAFVSNVDNLGAVIDPAILGHFVEHGYAFMMEVTDRTEADKKGGHLARHRDGRLVLRESAQCPPDEQAAFQDVARHRYFNTNNIWLSLPRLQAFLDANAGVVRLPMIRNTKTIDPRDPASPVVYQLETAMGAAIELFADAAALRVPRLRFAAVKKTGDLLGIRSDAFVLTDDSRIVPNPARTLGTLVVNLDDRFYAFIDQMEARFPHGAPSLLACEKLEVAGDVRFGRNVVVRGTVRVVNEGDAPREIPDGTVLSG
ncbi:MAG: UTP--glucose-1-phosphate uridylyltransferase [Deltaproteobacteria bacterium]|nr:UTP--glucose-1-phosphate uridylyltransferase [Deltaproteobacteria bacterium]